MSDTNFLQKAIAIVSQATDADRAEKYEEALNLYNRSLEYFLVAIKCTLYFAYYVCYL